MGLRMKALTGEKHLLKTLQKQLWYLLRLDGWGQGDRDAQHEDNLKVIRATPSSAILPPVIL